MEFRGIEIFKSSFDIIPFRNGRSFLVGVLCRTICQNIIQDRMLLGKSKPRFLRGFFDFFFIFIESFQSETTIVAAYPGSIFQLCPFLIVSKVRAQFLLEDPFVHGVCKTRIFVVSLIHLPCDFQTHAILLFENIIGVKHEVIEVVRSGEHSQRNIIIILSGI